VVVAGGCEGHRVLTGTALLGADPIFTAPPCLWVMHITFHPCDGSCLWWGSIYGACKCHANDSSWGVCGINHLNFNLLPPPVTNLQGFLSGTCWAKGPELHLGAGTPKSRYREKRRQKGWLAQQEPTTIIHTSGHLQFNWGASGVLQQGFKWWWNSSGVIINKAYSEPEKAEEKKVAVEMWHQAPPGLI